MASLTQALKHDLAQNGVTAALAPVPASWFQAVETAPKPEPKPAKTLHQSAISKAQPAPQAAAPKAPVAAKQQPQRQAASLMVEFAWVRPQAQVNLLLTVFNAAETSLSEAEQELLDNMMQACGVAPNSYGLAIAAGVGAHKSVQAANLPENTLIMGEGAAQAFTGKAESLMLLRDEYAGRITFHPKTLLAQPLLKKLAWGDLKNWQHGA